MILDIGCGPHKHAGAIGVDRRKMTGIDVICDFEEGLPFRRDTVTAVYLHNIVEHMPDLIAFMVELYRICEPGAKLYIRTPYYASREAFVDPTHVRYITEATFEYFDYPNEIRARHEHQKFGRSCTNAKSVSVPAALFPEMLPQVSVQRLHRDGSGPRSPQAFEAILTG